MTRAFRTQTSRMGSPADTAALYVATDLTALWRAVPGDPDAIEEDGREFRRVTPEYLEWLGTRMQRAAELHAQGNLAPEAWATLQGRFQQITRWVEAPSIVAVSGAEPHRYPIGGDLPFEFTVSPRALAQVHRIIPAALALGWSESQLLQNRGRYRFPCGEDYGLVCFVDDRRIGVVRREAIELLCSGGHTLTFRRAESSRR